MLFDIQYTYYLKLSVILRIIILNFLIIGKLDHVKIDIKIPTTTKIMEGFVYDP